MLLDFGNLQQEAVDLVLHVFLTLTSYAIKILHFLGFMISDL